MIWLYGKTGYAVFDVWFVVHLAFWLVVGAQAQVLGVSRMWTLLVSLFVALAWEFFERGAFKWWPEVWKHPESWGNAVVGDILLAGALGVLLGHWLAEQQ